MGIFGKEYKTNKIAAKLDEHIKKDEHAEKTRPKNTNQGTTRQTTLAIHYMREANNFPRTSGSHSADAELMQFLTGRNKDEIRKILGNPLRRGNDNSGKAAQILIADLELIRNKFIPLQLFDEISLIEKDIKSLENDIDDIKINH